MNGNTRSLRAAMKRRTLPLLLTLAVALCLGTIRPAAAQYPTTHSPNVATPYSWPGYHAGGLHDGPVVPALTPDGTNYTAANMTPIVPDALFGMGMGTPTGLVAGPYDTQIPSYLLGNYLPTNPPTGGGVNDVVSNHFADDYLNLPPDISVFYAPYATTNQILIGNAADTVTVDDQNATGFVLGSTPPTPAPGGSSITLADGTTVVTANWQTGVASTTASTRSDTTTPPAATYSRVPVAADANGNPLTILTKVMGGVVVQRFPNDHFATAVWTLTAPVAGSYKVAFSLPDPVQDTNPPSEQRIPDAHYVIRDNTGRILANTRVSQTETNTPQFLAGPFPLNALQSITVTLDNSTLQTTAVPSTTPLSATYVLADTMILQPAGGSGDIQGSPVAVNASEYPEITNALYAGYTTTPTPGTSVVPSPTATELNGNLTPTLTPTFNTRSIRQMVYFTRNESVTHLDVNGNLIAQSVGAIYGVDGFTGGVVWRYQTPGGDTLDPTGFIATGLAGTAKSTGAAGKTTFQIGPTANNGNAATQEGLPALDTAPGTIAAYTAYNGAPTPQINGDISKFGFALYAKTATTISANETDYTGTFRLYAPGYGYTADDGQILEHGTFTNLRVIFTDASNATLSGTFIADTGSLQPTGWPVPVDFSTTGPLTFTAQLQVSGTTQTLTNGVLRTAGAVSANAPPASAPIFSTPVVARIHVYAGPDPATGNPTYATRLVVMAADDAGFVYCLDAIGNRDGTSNTYAIDSVLDQPKYGLPSGSEYVQVNQANYVPHVGTTRAYWVYRPDPARAKIAVASRGTVGTVIAPVADSDLPTPGTFGLASPAVDILRRLTPDATSLPNTVTTGATAAPGAGPGAAATATDANGVLYSAFTASIYIGNSNGTLYKLNTRGVPLTIADIAPLLGTTVTTGDPFNASLGLTYQATQADITAGTTPDQIPTPTVQWWLPFNQAVTNSAQGSDSITSAPALGIVDNADTVHSAVTEIYLTTANNASNTGRLFRVNDKGPLDNTAANTAPVLAGTASPFTAAYSPGSAQYNLRAQAVWSFPNAYALVNGAVKTVRPALGSIGGSPVLFRKPSDGAAGTEHVYFAANVHREVQTDGTVDDIPLDAGEAGRIWCVNTDGTFNFAYPNALDPTVAANDVDAKPAVKQPSSPIGGFQNATPTIGMVQFPSIIEYGAGNAGGNNYVHTDGINATAPTGVKGQSVPMLYIGSIGTSDVLPRLYGIDLDGTDDSQRTVFADYSGAASAAGNLSNADAITYAGLPTDGGIASSIALVTNNTAAPATAGNGGALFVTETNGTLYQFDATPQSNDTSGTSTATGPDFGGYTIFSTAGPYSSPAVAAFNTSDLAGTTGTTKVVDYVYIGDSNTGLLAGLSPPLSTLDFGNGSGFGTNLPGPDTGGGQIGGNINLQQYPLYIYLFSDPAKAKVADMTGAVPIGATVPAFEWGDSVYIRIANVVPPVDATAAASASKRITLPATDYPSNTKYNSIFLTNGSPVSIQISETDRLGRVNVSQGADVGQVPAVLLPGLGTTPPGNGFVTDATPGHQTTDSSTPSHTTTFALHDAAGTPNYYIGAYTYAIGDGSSRKNTPGSRRRIITATQTAQAYGVDATGNITFLSTVTLSATARAGGDGRTVVDPVTGKRTRVFLSRSDQPTFAILNPLALNGSGLPIASISKDGNPQQIGPVLGPFGPVASPPTTSSELPAYSNGNRIYQNPGDLPKNGILGGNGTTVPILHTAQVVSTTGLIGHGTSGGTTDSAGNDLVGIADRSDLGPVGKSLKLTMVPTAMQWNDNSRPNGDFVNGEGSRINKLPWEDVPTAGRAGQNHSLDYPDIAQTAVRQVLSSSTGNATLTSSAAMPDPAGGTARAQVVKSNGINVQIRVPKYQPANTQLYDLTNDTLVAPADPGGYDTSKTHYIFPMGYTAQMRIFVDSDHNHVYSSGEAYRDLTVYTGVPMDMGTTITSATTDLGALTQGFGVQTVNYGLLGAFDPYSTPYQSFFKPITAFNNGNVNLVNLQFDQQLNFNNGSLPNQALSLLAGPLDANAILSGYDMAFVTGPLQPRFTLRSSIDSDLVNLATPMSPKDPRNPGLTTTVMDPFTNIAYNAEYLGVTFHKARPGDGSPTTLRVPDVPYNNNVPAFYVAPSSTGLPQVGASAVPYIGIAVPIGTPVGTYSQNVRLFEGIDPSVPGGYTFDPLKGPQYGGVYGGRGTPTTALANALTITNSGPAQPYSTATQVVAKVEEVRITDSTIATSVAAGTLPHGDAGTTAFNKGDFSPAGFRDISWNGGTRNGTGDINLFWTSSRDYAAPPPAKPPYNIVGKHLPYTVTSTSPKYGYFDSGATAASTWYTTITPNPGPVTNGVLFPDTTGLNTGLSVAQAQHLYGINGVGDAFFSRGRTYAFVQNTAAFGGAATGAPVYRNTIYCLQVDPATGQILDTLPDLTAGAAPRFGSTDTGANTVVSSDPAQAKFGVKSLKLPSSGTSAGTGGTVAFTDPLNSNTATNQIYRDLWAFWGSGARGRSSIAYTSTTTANTGEVSNTWTPTASLPVPAGLSSTADPSPVLTTAPDKSGNAVPTIDVTYTGIGPDGSADLYVSRYRPYMVQDATGTATTTVGLALSPFPSITETLQADTQVINWQARDVAWVRDTNTLDVAIKTPLNVLPISLTLAGLTPQYDRASGTLVYSGVTAGPSLTTYPNIGTATVIGKVDTVYIDLVRGRVRFRIKQTLSTGGTRVAYSLPTDAVVTATFASEARRITADTIADSEPITFLDEAFKPNEASFQTNLGRVQANRAWYIWRKAALGKTGQPTLFYKTQRLTVALVDGVTGLPTSIKLDANGVPQVTVTFPGGTLFSSAGGTSDIDWARGRIYLPITYVSGGTTYALEGQKITVSGTSASGNPLSVVDPTTGSTTVAVARWEDEGRYNDINFVPDDTSTAVPISTAVNEGTVSAFLDPMAYADVKAGAYDPFGNNTTTNNADQPHKVWLYWSSTRNGTADIYSEAIEPRFSVRIGGGSVP